MNQSETDPVKLAERIGTLTLIAGGLAKGDDPIGTGTVNLGENEDLAELGGMLKELLQGPYAGKEDEFFAEILDIIADPPNDENDPIEAIWTFALSFDPAVRSLG